MRITFQPVSGSKHANIFLCNLLIPLAADGGRLQVRRIAGVTAARGVLTRLYPEVVCTHRHILRGRVVRTLPSRATGGALPRTDGVTVRAATGG